MSNEGLEEDHEICDSEQPEWNHVICGSEIVKNNYKNSRFFWGGKRGSYIAKKVCTECPRNNYKLVSLANLNQYLYNGKSGIISIQSRYRPGVAQRIPGS